MTQDTITKNDPFELNVDFENDKTIKELTQEIVTDYKDYIRSGTEPWGYEIAARDLMVQVGSLTRALMRLHNERYVGEATKEELLTIVADELSDILADTLFIANHLGIDVARAWEDMKTSDKEKIDTREQNSKHSY